ncbi:hypothetical protein [Clostridium saccharoperbutylacetonicum]
MRNNDNLDNVIKSAIDDNIAYIEPSRDIFNEAWNKKEKEMCKREKFNIKHMKKVALVPACLITLSILGVFTFSPGARVAAEEILKTIFYPDKYGNVVEKSQETKVPVYSSPIPIDDENKSDIERRFGFNFNLPEKFGKYIYSKENDEVRMPYARIRVENVKYKDMDSIIHELIKALHEDKAYKELSKKYELTGNVDSKYTDGQGNEFWLTLMKENEASKDDNENIEQEITIDKIVCKIIKESQPEYNMKEVGNGVSRTDMESKPVDMVTKYNMEWEYDGVKYYIYVGKDLSKINEIKEFVSEYIKVL